MYTNILYNVTTEEIGNITLEEPKGSVKGIRS